MSPKVLIIDDESDILEAISLILKTQGIKTSLHTAPPSLDWIAKYKPQLILLDMLLIGKPGDEVCKEIKSCPQTKNIPIILLSANPVARLKTISKNCGANDYLPKPFELNDLLNVVKKHLTSCQLLTRF